MMDSLHNNRDGGGDHSADAPGIEAPAMIGQDERRMHVRAYNFWAKLLEGRSFPAIEALDLDDLGDFGPHAVLLDFTAGIENPAVCYVGDTLAHECELTQDVHYIADVPRRSLLSRLTDHYLQIIANRAPIGFEAEFVNSRGVTIMYRGVLLPFSSDDDTIDFIMGVINWKQVAEPELADALASEMAAAAQVVRQSARPTVPVWADGPESAMDALSGIGGVDGDDDAADSLIVDEDWDNATPSSRFSRPMALGRQDPVLTLGAAQRLDRDDVVARHVPGADGYGDDDSDGAADNDGAFM
ncbi:MAG: hypothetical protein ACKOUM_01740, partial [Sphingopyxis sp.]